MILFCDGNIFSVSRHGFKKYQTIDRVRSVLNTYYLNRFVLMTDENESSHFRSLYKAHSSVSHTVMLGIP